MRQETPWHRHFRSVDSAPCWAVADGRDRQHGPLGLGTWVARLWSPGWLSPGSPGRAVSGWTGSKARLLLDPRAAKRAPEHPAPPVPQGTGGVFLSRCCGASRRRGGPGRTARPERWPGPGAAWREGGSRSSLPEYLRRQVSQESGTSGDRYRRRAVPQESGRASQNAVGLPKGRPAGCTRECRVGSVRELQSFTSTTWSTLKS